jgi:hypothetical protein
VSPSAGCNAAPPAQVPGSRRRTGRRASRPPGLCRRRPPAGAQCGRPPSRRRRVAGRVTPWPTRTSRRVPSFGPVDAATDCGLRAYRNWRNEAMVVRRSATPLFAGSIPAGASLEDNELARARQVPRRVVGTNSGTDRGGAWRHAPPRGNREARVARHARRRQRLLGPYVGRVPQLRGVPRRPRDRAGPAALGTRRAGARVPGLPPDRCPGRDVRTPEPRRRRDPLSPGEPRRRRAAFGTPHGPGGGP